MQMDVSQSTTLTQAMYLPRYGIFTGGIADGLKVAIFVEWVRVMRTVERLKLRYKFHPKRIS